MNRNSMERCYKCKKKAIVVFKCTCEKTVCLKCRHPEDHGCTHDHGAAFKETNTLNNPKVIAKKVESI